MSDYAMDFAQQELQCSIHLLQEDQQDLDQAAPALDHALAAVNVISKVDIAELKTLRKLPLAVEKTLQAVVILFGMPTVWETIKSSLLGDPYFISSLGYASLTQAAFLMRQLAALSRSWQTKT